MLGWLRRIFGGQAAPQPPAPMPAPAVAPVAAPPPAPKPAPPPYVPNLPNAAGLVAQALSEHSRPLPTPEPPPAPAPPAAPALGEDETLVLLQVARGSPRRAWPAVTAALQEMTGDRPNLHRVPNRAQVTRALRRLGRDPARAAALLEQVELLEGATRRR